MVKNENFRKLNWTRAIEKNTVPDYLLNWHSLQSPSDFSEPIGWNGISDSTVIGWGTWFIVSTNIKSGKWEPFWHFTPDKSDDTGHGKAAHGQSDDDSGNFENCTCLLNPGFDWHYTSSASCKCYYLVVLWYTPHIQLLAELPSLIRLVLNSSRPDYTYSWHCIDSSRF